MRVLTFLPGDGAARASCHGLEHPAPRWLAGLLAALVAVSCTAPPAEHGSVTAIENVHVVTMMDDRVLEAQTVLVRGAAVADLGPSGSVAVPRDAKRIDGAGGYLIPGLVDAHVHLAPDETFHDTYLELFLGQGVTTVMVMAGQPEILELRRRIAEGERPGPSLVVSTPIVNDREMTREEGRNFALEAHDAGYDAIKVYSSLSPDGFRGIAAAAETTGMPVVGHIPQAVGLEGALAAGQRLIGHAEEILYGGLDFKVADLTNPPREDLPDAAIDDLVATIAEHGAWVSPTLLTFETIADWSEDVEAVLARPESAYFPPAVRTVTGWRPATSRYLKTFTTPEHIARLRAAQVYQHRLVDKLRAAGVPLLAGTDAPNPGVVPGFSLAGELERLVLAGLTPFEALRAATRNPFGFLGREIGGAIAPGQRADLVLLASNPLADIRAVRDPVGVMYGGRWLDAEARAATLRRLARVNQRQAECLEALRAGEVAVARDILERAKREDPGYPVVSEVEVNIVGYGFLGREDPETAVEVLAWNAELFPSSANVYDSLAEAQVAAGRPEAAIPLYEKVQAMDPGGAVGRNATQMLERLRAEAEPD